MGRLWRIHLGRNPGARKGDGLAGHEEGVIIEELSSYSCLDPKTYAWTDD